MNSLNMTSLAIILALNSFQADATGPGIRGIYALGSAKESEIPEAALANPYVDGIALRFFWDQLEPKEGLFDWTIVDRQIAACRAHGKWVSISVTPGIHTPAWVYSKGASAFKYPWNRPFGPAPCSEQRIPIPWDSNYFSQWSRLNLEIKCSSEQVMTANVG